MRLLINDLLHESIEIYNAQKTIALWEFFSSTKHKCLSVSESSIQMLIVPLFTINKCVYCKV